MIWKGRELVTDADFMDFGIGRCDSKEEAREFIKEYVSENFNARSHIGYLAANYSVKDKHRIFDWFDCVHPVFGTEEWDVQTILEMGMKFGRNVLNKDEPKPLPKSNDNSQLSTTTFL